MRIIAKYQRMRNKFSVRSRISLFLSHFIISLCHGKHLIRRLYNLNSSLRFNSWPKRVILAAFGILLSFNISTNTSHMWYYDDPNSDTNHTNDDANNKAVQKSYLREKLVVIIIITVTIAIVQLKNSYVVCTKDFIKANNSARISLTSVKIIWVCLIV